MSAAIYALKIGEEIVYVGKSEQVEVRIAGHFSSIRAQRGLAAQYPEVFSGKVVTATILELIDFGEEPSLDRSSNAAFNRTYPAWVKWGDSIAAALRDRELYFIRLHRPRCNKRGLEPVKVQLTLNNLSSFAITCPTVIPDADAEQDA